MTRPNIALVAGMDVELELDALRRLIDRAQTLDELAINVARGLPFIASLSDARQAEVNVLVDARAASVAPDFDNADRLTLFAEIADRAHRCGLGVRIEQTPAGRFNVVVARP